MKMQKSNIARNLTTLRQLNKFSQEDVAERIGVTRQAVAKWEAGESVPDILNCDALAKLYDVELDDLIHYDQEQTGESIPPKGKHIFGTVRVGERGQIVLPKQARDVFKIKPGDAELDESISILKFNLFTHLQSPTFFLLLYFFYSFNAVFDIKHLTNI